MKLVPITEIFDIRYGNQFDLSKMDILSDGTGGINFVSRTSENNGSMATVASYNDIEPFEAWLITVTLGGSYLLASFVQPKPFYTGQNIKVLKPKSQLSEWEKLYYCACIEANRFRYSSHSREANSTFNTILVPSPEEIPESVQLYNLDDKFIKKPLSNKKTAFDTKSWEYFEIWNLFEIKTRKDKNLLESGEWKVPYISSRGDRNGVNSYVQVDDYEKWNCITVARNGSVWSTFYHSYNFVTSPDDVRILIPKTTFNKYIAIFIITLIEKEKYRYAYGRKFWTWRMQTTKIKLPVTSAWTPDWQWMEDYIKSLPYSASL